MAGLKSPIPEAQSRQVLGEELPLHESWGDAVGATQGQSRQALGKELPLLGLRVSVFAPLCETHAFAYPRSQFGVGD